MHSRQLSLQYSTICACRDGTLLGRGAVHFLRRETRAEAVTLVSADHVPDEVYTEVRKHFTDEELIYLTLAIISINGWNRLAISFRTVPA